MDYDARFPIAVFVGPTIGVEAARAILPHANYYPPAKMGDVYLLLGTGVRRILVVDGVFHSATPVWQRELLAALDLGIEVYGASSMGALRAVELCPFGMIGVGTIFEWYRDGVIDADDEVALMHGDEAAGYRALSEPLVNMRATLAAAADVGVVSPAEAEEALAWARSTFYAERSYADLLRRAAVAWPAETARRFGEFVRRHAVNLKEADARAALRLVAAEAPGRNPAGLPKGRSGEDRFDRSVSALLRGIPVNGGSLRTAKELLDDLIRADRLAPDVRQQVSRDSFLALAADARHLTCPEWFFRSYRSEWLARYPRGSDGLPCTGLTDREWEAAIYDRATIAWAAGGTGHGEDDLLRAWASDHGITAPPGMDLVGWMVEKTPGHFGYVDWSPDAALVRHLQLRNAIGGDEPCPAR